MRPRLDREDLMLVLEGLADLYIKYAAKEDSHMARKIFLLFDSLVHTRTGRRRDWIWHERELILKRRSNYRDMQNLISNLRDQKEESESE